MLTLNDGRAELWQWDTGRTLSVDADCSQVHFSNKVFGRSIDVNVVDGAAIIPDVLLQTDNDLNVWAFVGTAENGYTKISKTFKVNRRNKPADYVFTPTDQMTLKTIQSQIGNLADLTTESKGTLVAAINEAARTGGGAGSMDLRVADGYVQYSADGGSTWQNLIAVAELTPVKGTDYWTAADKAEVVAESAAAIDLTSYAKKNEVPTKTSQLTNDSGFLTSHQDISGKQDKATLEADVAAKGFTKNTGTYSKPAGGIPKSDLDAAVQTSLGKADTALQEHQSLAAYRTAAAQDEIDSGKVDKVTGKGLSTNDYTAAAKAKVDAIPANPKYTDTVYDDTALKERVATIEGKESAWDAKLNASELPTAINTALAQAKASGEFDGADGAPGKDAPQDAIRYGVQTLTDGQQVQARNNIGAVSQADFDILVEGLTAKPGIVSDNKFDNVFDETGKIDFTTGQNTNASTLHRTSNYHELWDDFDGTVYVGFPAQTSTSEQKVQFFFYDENKSFIGYSYFRAKDTATLTTADGNLANAASGLENLSQAKYYRVCKTIAWDVSIYISPVTQPSADDIDYTYEYSEGGTTGGITIKAEKKLTGKIIANFGDSIFGKRRPPEDISTKLAELTGATVYNCGFGGCHMSNHWASTYNAFSMCNLVDAIVSKDWTSQDTAIAETSSNVVPSYFSEALEILKGLDFSKVDIVTIAYGTNDFTAADALDNSENAYDKESFAGALRYSIETLLTAYPNLKIFVCSQTYRFWMDDFYVFTEDSDTHQNTNGVKLTDFVAKTEEIAKAYHLPFIDNYYGLGFNKFNRTEYFLNSQGAVTDGTHPNTVGCRLIAEHMANQLF